MTPAKRQETASIRGTITTLEGRCSQTNKRNGSARLFETANGTETRQQTARQQDSKRHGNKNDYPQRQVGGIFGAKIPKHHQTPHWHTRKLVFDHRGFRTMKSMPIPSKHFLRDACMLAWSPALSSSLTRPSLSGWSKLRTKPDTNATKEERNSSEETDSERRLRPRRSGFQRIVNRFTRVDVNRGRGKSFLQLQRYSHMSTKYVLCPRDPSRATL